MNVSVSLFTVNIACINSSDIIVCIPPPSLLRGGGGGGGGGGAEGRVTKNQYIADLQI